MHRSSSLDIITVSGQSNPRYMLVLFKHKKFSKQSKHV
jgi:hypothetical protein